MVAYHVTAAPMSTTAKKSTHPLVELYHRPGFLLRRAHQLSVAIFERECQHLEVTPAQYGVLTVLSQARGIGQSDLSRALGFDRVTTLRLVHALQERGLVQRHPSADDGRRLELEVSAKGLKVLRDAQAPADRAYQRLLDPLALRERQQLMQLLAKLCEALEAEARAPLVPPALS
jgi:DNA-binding MarR family transcriptional regulator